MNALLLDILKLIVGPLVGALMGSSLAYMYQRRKARQDERNANRSALIKAQISLICHISSLENMRRHYLPFKDLEDRELLIVRSEHTFDHSSIDIASLSFLVDFNKGDSIMNLYLADKQYKTVCAAVKDRNDYRAKFDDAVTFEGFDSNTGSAMGTGHAKMFYMLKRYTDIMYQGIELALRECIDAAEATRLLGRELFPGSNFPATRTLPQQPAPAEPQNPAS